MKRNPVSLLSAILIFASPMLSANELNLSCDYVVESRGKTAGQMNLSKPIGMTPVSAIFFIKTDNGDYLDKITMSVGDSGEYSFDFRHPSEFEDEYDTVGVQVEETSIAIKRLTVIDNKNIFARADLDISRQTGAVTGEWTITWKTEGIALDRHKLSGSCSKYVQAF